MPYMKIVCAGGRVVEALFQYPTTTASVLDEYGVDHDNCKVVVNGNTVDPYAQLDPENNGFGKAVITSVIQNIKAGLPFFVRVSMLGASIREAGLEPGDTVAKAINAADMEAPAGASYNYNGTPVTEDTALYPGDGVNLLLISPNTKGG
jgi:hypothetical protein